MADMIKILRRQKQFSMRAFGPGYAAARVIDHARKELAEIERAPTDLEEWIDLAMLAFDGAWRAGFTPDEVVNAYVAKLAKNEARTWPDWRTADPDKAIEHVRDGEHANAHDDLVGALENVCSLLAVVQSVYGVHVLISVPNEQDGNQYVSVKLALDHARAAIAKAKGGAS